MEDGKIIELFFARSERAIVEVQRRFGSLCLRFSENMLGNFADAEECVDDAYVALWNNIPPEKPNSLKTYLLKILRNISLNRFHENTSQKHGGGNAIAETPIEEMEEFLTDSNTVEKEIENNELKKNLEDFLDMLSQENRVIFVRRYWFSDSYEDISKRTGLNEKVISVRLVRMKKQLKDYLEEKGVAI